MPLFKRRAVPIPATQQQGYYNTRPSPMTRLKRMLAPRHTRHTHTRQTHTAGGAAGNPVAAVEREGRRAKRFFTRRAHAATATGGGAPVTARRRRGLFSSRRGRGHGHTHGGVAAVPVAGGGPPHGTAAGGYPHRKRGFSLASLFSRRTPRNRGPYVA
ncbi:hypothetical protein BGW39_000809 [Mortierella sp. 14UC]|nr:hypothetical protein BGW39_000809 [Mortierella sp. 14UC]